MEQNTDHKVFFAGLSLSNSSNYDTGIAVMDESRKIISLDKLYTIDDIKLWLDNYQSKKQTVFMVSTPSDNTLLDGKWRVHSKNYKMICENFKVNRQNWTNRNSPRAADLLKALKEQGGEVYRFDIFQLRQAYGLCPHYVNRSSLDCKSLQNALRIKYDFRGLPENMLPASNLEAILGAMFALDVHKGTKTKKLYEYMGIDVLAKM